MTLSKVLNFETCTNQSAHCRGRKALKAGNGIVRDDPQTKRWITQQQARELCRLMTSSSSLGSYRKLRDWAAPAGTEKCCPIPVSFRCPAPRIEATIAEAKMFLGCMPILDSFRPSVTKSGPSKSRWLSAALRLPSFPIMQTPTAMPLLHKSLSGG